MNKELLVRINEAPERGWMLVYDRREIIFEPYDSLESVIEKIRQKEILEMHLFDEAKEYRMVLSGSKRFEKSNGIIEYISDFPATKDSVFSEDVLLEGMGGKIRVLNNIQYDDTGMAVITDARLIMKGQ